MPTRVEQAARRVNNFPGRFILTEQKGSRHGEKEEEGVLLIV